MVVSNTLIFYLGSETPSQVSGATPWDTQPDPQTFPDDALDELLERPCSVKPSAAKGPLERVTRKIYPK